MRTPQCPDDVSGYSNDPDPPERPDLFDRPSNARAFTHAVQREDQSDGEERESDGIETCARPARVSEPAVELKGTKDPEDAERDVDQKDGLPSKVGNQEAPDRRTCGRRHEEQDCNGGRH